MQISLNVFSSLARNQAKKKTHEGNHKTLGRGARRRDVKTAKKAP
jgi:hypothetical protein